MLSKTNIAIMFTQDIQRWLIMFLVGVLTALVACSIDITIEMLAKIKYGLLREWTDHCVEGIFTLDVLES